MRTHLLSPRPILPGPKPQMDPVARNMGAISLILKDVEDKLVAALNNRQEGTFKMEVRLVGVDYRDYEAGFCNKIKLQ